MKITNIILIITILVSSFQIGVAQNSFTGSMKLKRVTNVDTTYYNYFVSGDNVRIEELNSDEEIEGVMLLNIKEKKITALSPLRKLYFHIAHKPSSKDIKSQLEITKSKNKKTIAGQVCEQWIVKNRSENTVISYWVIPNGYGFFEEFLITLNRKDKIPTYFLQIDNIGGAIPLLSVERTMVRDEISRLEVVNLTKKAVPAELFSIPPGYQEVKNNK